jgi:hypothetical protein
MLSSDIEESISRSGLVSAYFIENTNVENYAEILAKLYQITSNSCPLMEYCLIIIQLYGIDNSSERILANYLEQHITEEQGHDQWIKQDFDNVCTEFNLKILFPQKSILENLVSFIFRSIKNGDYWILIGYIWSIESRPPSVELITKLSNRLSLNRNMTKTYKEHAIIDIHHRLDLIRLINNVESKTIMSQIEFGAMISSKIITKFWIHQLQKAKLI